MTTTRYKGYQILARSYQLQPSTRWTVDLEIGRHGRRESFSTNERYHTEQEAQARCAGLGRRIIDGKVQGWSVGHLRESWAESVSRRSNGGFMRQLVIVGIVILGLGAVALLRHNAVVRTEAGFTLADDDPTADDRTGISPWLAGGGVAAGLALIMVGARPRA